MEMSPQLSLSQKQQLKLSPQLLQSFELMALPLTELQQRIKREIEANPALELPSSSDFSYEHFAQERQQKEAHSIDDSYSDSSSYGSDYSGYDYEASDRQQKFMENALSNEETLQEHLLSQLGCESISDEEYAIGVILITNLDENGFFRQDPKTLVSAEQETLANKLLELLQQFDPVGIAARDWRESLVLQAKATKMQAEDLAHFTALVYDNLELMRANKKAQVAKNLDIDDEELEELYAFLKTLTPFPGQAFSSGPQQYVLPDLSIKQEQGELVLSMNSTSLPDLRINPSFTSLADELGPSQEAKEAQQYIQQQLKNANSLIFQVQVRNQTLYRVAQVLLVEQQEFFLYGPQYIKPLTQKSVAQQVGVHETTISRISTAKYIDTDWGIIPIKKLFSNAVGDEGAELSKQAVKEIIRQILEEHQGQKALSDQKISDLLKERGITVARRTVAKYRGELNIDASFIRGTN